MSLPLSFRREQVQDQRYTDVLFMRVFSSPRSPYLWLSPDTVRHDVFAGRSARRHLTYKAARRWRGVISTKEKRQDVKDQGLFSSPITINAVIGRWNKHRGSRDKAKIVRPLFGVLGVDCSETVIMSRKWMPQRLYILYGSKDGSSCQFFLYMAVASSAE